MSTLEVSYFVQRRQKGVFQGIGTCCVAFKLQWYNGCWLWVKYLNEYHLGWGWGDISCLVTGTILCFALHFHRVARAWPCQNCLNVQYYFLKSVECCYTFCWISQLYLNKILFCPMVIEERHSPNLVPMVTVKLFIHTLVCVVASWPCLQDSQAGKDLGVKWCYQSLDSGLCAPRFLSLTLLYCCHRSLGITASQQQKPDRLCPESLLTKLSIYSWMKQHTYMDL